MYFLLFSTFYYFQLDIYIMPIVNVDGYEYSRAHWITRLWRKTRSRSSKDTECQGVDINRNFGFKWGGLGMSKDFCDDLYGGPKAFSEPEAKAVKDFIESKHGLVNWKIYVSLHNYGQQLLFPWGYTYTRVQDYDQLLALGTAAAKALESVYGTRYTVGSVTEIMDAGSGGSDDWAMGSGMFKYAYTMEMRDEGQFGFFLPADQIIPNSIEAWEAIKVFANFLMKSKNKS